MESEGEKECISSKAMKPKVAADGGRSEREKKEKKGKHVYFLQGEGGGTGSNETDGKCAAR